MKYGDLSEEERRQFHMKQEAERVPVPVLEYVDTNRFGERIIRRRMLTEDEADWLRKLFNQNNDESR